jgi:hypothetical protein
MDPHKVEALTNVNLPYPLGIRDYFWSAVFGLSLVPFLRRGHPWPCTRG